MPKQATPQQPKLSKGQRKRARKAARLAAGLAALTPRQRAGAAQQAMSIVRPNLHKQFASYQGGGAMHLMHLLSLPGDVPMTRMPTQDMPRTATLKYRVPSEYYEPQHSTSWAVEPGTSLFCVIGHPALHWMTRVVPDPADPITATCYLGSASVSVADPSGFYATPTDGTAAGSPQETIPLNYYLDFVRVHVTSPKTELGGPIITGPGERYVYMPYLATFEATIGYVTDPMAIEAGVMSNYLPDEIGITLKLEPLAGLNGSVGATQSIVATTKPSSESAAAQHNVSIVNLVEGWYRVNIASVTLYHSTAIEARTSSIKRVNVGATRIRYATDSTSPYWKMYPTSQLRSQPEMGAEMRRTTASFLLTNTSSELVAQGNVVASRLLRCAPAEVSAVSLIDKVKYSTSQYTGKASNGVYTYLAFDDVDERFTEVTNRDGGFLVDKTYLTAGYMNVITVHNNAYNTYPNTYLITTDIGVEFKGSLADREYAVPSGSFLDLVESRRINNATVYFHENPVHWSTISRYLHSMWSFLRSHATVIGGAASAVFPEAAPAIMPVARMLQK